MDFIWYLTDAVWWPAHYGYGNNYGDSGSGYGYGNSYGDGCGYGYSNDGYGYNNGYGNGNGYYNYE